MIPDTATWPDSAAEAVRAQQALRARVRLEPLSVPPRKIAGVDVSHDRTDNSHAALVVLDAESLTPIECVRISAPTRFPYIPGLLSFREIPVILQALERLKETPDLFMVDGHGVAHPRRLGIAAHLGVLLDMPAIGVAKSRLTGRYEEPGPEKGAASPLFQGGEMIGNVLRSKERCRPLFISAGHKIDQEQALALTLRCLTRYRLPEPTRLADKLSGEKGMTLPGL